MDKQTLEKAIKEVPIQFNSLGFMLEERYLDSPKIKELENNIAILIDAANDDKIRIPMVPGRDIGSERYHNGEHWDSISCPVCEKKFTVRSRDFRYCTNCGCALDWENYYKAWGIKV